ncbi:hypothetical protein PRZ48_007619 [Zasmidium cellare]|uniref:Myb-like domain-containing protein n=1 Tax=Zasmidium cellare TaxID=395010 RepID=A0ABR0EKX1_ZASCE|nr:hypothetical protein PRZ48_007619 [Zasmidium cellare]
MVNWDDLEQKKLLFAMVTLLQANKPASWENVAAMLGEGYKANAIRQQWPKIKKECASQVGTIVEGGGASTGTPTKAKPRAKKAASEKSTGKRKSKKDVDDENDDGEDDAEESPSKKMKVKDEKIEESGDDEV